MQKFFLFLLLLLLLFFFFNINTFMNLAKNQVKTSVDFQSSTNGAILKNSIVSTLLLSSQLLKGSVVCSCLVANSCLILCDPVDCSPPGSSSYVIFQTRTLAWVAMPSSRRIYPTQGLKPGLSLQADSLPLSHLDPT